MAKRAKILKIVAAIAGMIVLFSVLIAYSRYVALKKAFVSKVSYKMSALAGQEVKIGDLTFGPSAEINIHNIALENPQGFGEGQLLKVKKVSLQMNLPELLKGRLSVRTVEITAPELTLMQDANKKLNISDTLRALLSKKGTSKYQVDTLMVRSGTFDMNKDPLYHTGDIAVTLRHLSSDSGVKTLIEVSASPPGKSRISINGWAYLNDNPKKIDLSASWKDIQLSLFEKITGKETAAGRNLGTVDLDLHAGGDTKNGIALKSEMQLKKAQFPFFERNMKVVTLNAFLKLSDDSFVINNAVLNADGVSTLQLEGVVTDISKTPSYKVQLKVNVTDLSVFNPPEGLKLGGALISDGITINGKLDKTLPALAGALQLRNVSIKYEGIHAETADVRITFNGTAESVSSLRGSASARVQKLSVARTEGNKSLIKNAELSSDFAFHGKDLNLKMNVRAGKMTAAVTGTVNGFMGEGRSARFKAVLPETGLADVRSAFWDVFPDKMLYAGLNGSIAADVSLAYSERALSAQGELRVTNVTMDGENGEYSIGPVNGSVPLLYAKDNSSETPPSMPSFELNQFQELSEYYARKQPEESSHKLTIGSLRYGFRLLDNITVWMNPKGSYLNIGRFDANIFGGKLSGSAVVDFSGVINYRAGMLVKGISLTRLCEDITPIKGYITGKVDGLALLKGSGAGINGLIGRADFWTYTAGGEKTKISKEFLQKIGGPQIKSYLGARPFDKGIISLYLQNGFLIFKELEISHKNLLGMTDLAVKVAPFNNRIELSHLMSTIAEAAERAKEK